ncbi:hypothetical protein ABRZ04_04330 [Castellaniella ginsengisoli]|uniref:Uncharacterized protein n=1 Tax=Castellaniella ginsengisoli TaxID=546114 RepID=A0AB39D297_9BURK
MTKTTMPAPVAAMWWEDESGGRQAPVRRLEVWPPFEPLSEFSTLITTDQAESYAAAKVREALADLLNTLETQEFDGGQRQIASHIRILITSTPA